MKKTLVAAFAALLATSALADGAETFAKKCAVCHGKDLAGGKIVGRSIAGTPAAHVKEVVTKGFGKMKPVKVDNLDEVAGFVAAAKK